MRSTMTLSMAAVALIAAGAPARAAEPTADELRAIGVEVREANGAVAELRVDAAKFDEDGFRLVGRCASLKKLSIRGAALNDATLPLLSGLAALEELSTDGTALSDEGYRHFAAFGNLRSLALFHPSWKLESFTGAGLAHLKALPKLERLVFAGSTARDAGMEAVGQLAPLKEFQSWHTMQTQAGNAHLVSLTNLVSLKLGQRLPSGGARPPPSLDASTIPVLARIASLERLELFEARLRAADFEPLKVLPNLKKLTLHTMDIAAEDVEALRRMFPNVEIVFKPMTAEEIEQSLTKKLRI